jgi:hypothetical protein
MSESISDISVFAPDWRRILAAGGAAPSGENAQPWRFVAAGRSVEVRIAADRDRSPYNSGFGAAYIACGAAAENIALEAGLAGCRAIVLPAPDPGDPMLAARVRLEAGPAAPDPLASQIPARSTNRKRYERAPLDQRILSALSDQGLAFGGTAAIRLSADPAAIRDIALTGALNERLMLSNRTMHRFFFDHLDCGKAPGRSGFKPADLELDAAALAILRVARHWPAARLLGWIGLPRAVARQSLGTYSAAGAVGVVTCPERRPAGWVAAGRLLQRIWLTATALGLSFQPLAGVMLLDAGGSDALSDRQRRMANEAAGRVRRRFDLGGEAGVVPFRVGLSEPPSGRSGRLPVDEIAEFPDTDGSEDC